MARETTYAAKVTAQKIFTLKNRSNMDNQSFKDFCGWLGYSSFLGGNSHHTNKKIHMALEDLVINATPVYEEQYNE